MRVPRSLIKAGIERGMREREKRQLLLTNYISILLSTTMFLLVIIRKFIFKQYVPVEQQAYFVLFLLPILLNKLHFTRLSRVVLSYIPVVVVWLAFAVPMADHPQPEQSMYDGIRLFIISVSLIPYLVFDRSRFAFLLTSILPALISVLFFDVIIDYLGIGYNVTGVQGVDFQLMTMRTIVGYLIVNTACYILLAMVAENEDTNRKLIEELNRKTEHINEQNLELSRSKQELLQLNRYLEKLVEEKTSDIRKQNQVLANYAFTNAHKLRGPVARILGLINISRLNDGIDYPWLFRTLETETKEIDQVIKSVSAELDAGERRETDVVKVKAG